MPVHGFQHQLLNLLRVSSCIVLVVCRSVWWHLFADWCWIIFRWAQLSKKSVTRNSCYRIDKSTEGGGGSCSRVILSSHKHIYASSEDTYMHTLAHTCGFKYMIDNTHTTRTYTYMYKKRTPKYTWLTLPCITKRLYYVACLPS